MDYPQWLHVLAWLALATGFVSAGAIAVWVVQHPRKMTVMNIVWPVSGLYLGPIALWLLYRSEQSKGAQSQGDDDDGPTAQQTAVSVLHCGAGCTLGDIVGEFAVFFVTVTLLGEVLFAEYVADFAIAFTLGIIFQYFAIVPMRGLSPVEGLKQAIRADFLSITAFQIGMFIWMAFTYYVLLDSPRLEPDSPIYWASMQVAMILGFLTSYPANVFLIRKGWKEKMS